MTESAPSPAFPLTIEERVRRYPADDLTIIHIVSPQREATHDWAPIKCSKTDGITFPGPTRRDRSPTCPDCKAVQ